MSDQVTVICLESRAGKGATLSKGDEWTIPVAKASRLIEAGQVRLKDAADAPTIAAYRESQEIVPAAAPKPASPEPIENPPSLQVGQAPQDDDFDESGSVNENDPIPGEPQTALQKAAAKKKAAKKS